LYNTIIVGNGPIGSYLAYKLTLVGQKVLVLDKKTSPGQNICCTGIISKECFNLLEIASNSVIGQARSAKLFSPSGKCIRFWHEDDVALITDRLALEQALANKAQRIGAEYRYNNQVESIEYDNNCLTIKINDSNGHNFIKAEAAIIATGYGSSLTQNLGLGKIKQFSIGAQAEVAINKVEEIEIYFDQKISPGGFAWLVPIKNGRGLAGLLTNEQPQLRFSQFLLNLKAQNKITSTDVTENYAPIPQQPLPRTYAERILVVGEAAGQVKPTTGGGIYFGIVCADIAASVLCQAFKAGDLSAARLSNYQKQWHSKLLRELTIDYWMQRLWAKLNNKQIDCLFTIAQSKHLPDLIAINKKISFDWHSQSILQIAFSLLSFAKPRKQL
jgi:digeranylgeranylglycerophospholipid reductase